MRDDEAPLTPQQQRAFLLIELRHWQGLAADARVCNLRAIYRRRLDRLRTLRRQLADLDAKAAGEARKRA